MTSGLSIQEIKKLRKQYGLNTLQDDQVQHRAVKAFLIRFKNPLVIILIFAATLSLFFGDRASFFIITTIVLLSVTLDFVNTYRSEKAADALKDKVRVRVNVIRYGKEHQIPSIDLVPGDVVRLAAGKVIPADGEIIEGNDLSANESSLTGESFPQTKPIGATVYMGSGVVSGSGLMKVTKIGHSTKFAKIAKSLQSSKRVTEFESEISKFSMLIIKITFALVVFVLVVNIVFQRNPLESVLFALALAVGLTPELLPLIINLNLTKGSLKMAHEGVIVKQLSAVQNFGSMDVLCTDKTGTLTENKIKLVKYVDGFGHDSDQVLKIGYITSSLTTSFANPLDSAVRAGYKMDISMYQKIDEIPFDFERKREAVVIHHKDQAKRYLYVEGAPEEVLKISTFYQTQSQHLNESSIKEIKRVYDALSKQGFRVLSVATKQIGLEKRYDPADEKDMIFHGFLAFLDPAKASVSETLQRMELLGITTKIITGDNGYVTEKIAHDIGLKVTGILNGDQIQRMSMVQLASAVEHTTIFARVNPEQKLAIIQALQRRGHIVGYMGDGINDAPSLKMADVSVSVDNAVDVAKDAADFILLRKNLHELVNGVEEGRKTFSNTMKYLRMSLSSNFGNMFSMAGASLFLPFLPMLATQILLNNLLYDVSQFAIPLDNVDGGEILKPHTMNLKGIKKFMWSYGLLSSAFDFITFGVLIFIFHANQATFQAGWFIESIMTQVLVVYIIRTRLVPFRDSLPARALVISTLGIIGAAFIVILTPIRDIFKFGLLMPAQIGTLVMIVALYLVLAEVLKHKFYRAYE